MSKASLPYEVIDLPYPREYRTLWRNRHLQCTWFREYEDLFDCDDLRLAMRPDGRTYEFGEWFTAIDFWKRGFNVLLPKYTHPKNKVKYAKAVKLLGKANVERLAKPGRPDLLAYKGKRHLAFVEVKVKGDQVRPHQERMMRWISEHFSSGSVVDVFVYKLRPKGPRRD